MKLKKLCLDIRIENKNNDLTKKSWNKKYVSRNKDKIQLTMRNIKE